MTPSSRSSSRRPVSRRQRSKRNAWAAARDFCRRGSAASQHGPDARDQLAAAERLGQVIVGAHLQSDHPVHLVALGGEHDDRDVRLGAQAPAQRQAVLAGQHQVEQDEVDPAVGQDLAHGTPVSRGADAKAFLGQRTRDEIADLAVVVDDQDVRSALHAGNIDEPARTRSGNVCRSVAGRRLTNFVTKNPASEKLQ